MRKVLSPSPGAPGKGSGQHHTCRCDGRLRVRSNVRRSATERGNKRFTRTHRATSILIKLVECLSAPVNFLLRKGHCRVGGDSAAALLGTKEMILLLATFFYFACSKSRILRAQG